ncbi:MAG: relaxase domain-containing protein, partial [Bacteroidota bacterium]
MLRITQNSSAKGAASYFDANLGKADYYATGEHTIGSWGGKAAERLELNGEVSKKDFVAL